MTQYDCMALYDYYELCDDDNVLNQNLCCPCFAGVFFGASCCSISGKYPHATHITVDIRQMWTDDPAHSIFGGAGSGKGSKKGKGRGKRCDLDEFGCTWLLLLI